MSTDAHERCSKAIRSLRFNWIQNPEVILNEKLQIVGLNSDYLKNDPELFEVFRRKLYRRLNKRYHGLLDFIIPAYFLWQIKIMWIMLKCKSRNKNTYEQTRKAITILQLRKLPTYGNVVEKRVVDTIPKQSKNNDFACKPPRDLAPIVKENKVLKTVGVLQKTRFTWKRSPIKVFIEILRVVGLQLVVFKEDSILFRKLKYRLGRKFQVGEFYKYHTLIGLINQNDFQWQIDTIWEMLFNIKLGEECYGLLELLLQAENVARDE